MCNTCSRLLARASSAVPVGNASASQANLSHLSCRRSRDDYYSTACPSRALSTPGIDPHSRRRLGYVPRGRPRGGSVRSRARDGVDVIWSSRQRSWCNRVTSPGERVVATARPSRRSEVGGEHPTSPGRVFAGIATPGPDETEATKFGWLGSVVTSRIRRLGNRRGHRVPSWGSAFGGCHRPRLAPARVSTTERSRVQAVSSRPPPESEPRPRAPSPPLEPANSSPQPETAPPLP